MRASILDHLPAECARGRLFVDVPRLLAGTGSQDELAQRLGEAFQGADPKRSRAALSVLKEGGLDPATSLHQIAACIDRENGFTAAVELDLSQLRGDFLALLNAAAKQAGRPPAAIKTEGALTYLAVPDRPVLVARMGPGVVVVASDLTRLRAARQGGGAPGFAAARKSLAFVDLSLPEQGRMNVALLPAGDELRVEGWMQMIGTQADHLRRDPKGTLRQLRAMLAEAAGRLDHTPLQGFDAEVRSLELTADGDRLQAKIQLPRERAQQLVRQLLHVKPQTLSRVRPAPSSARRAAPR